MQSLSASTFYSVVGLSHVAAREHRKKKEFREDAITLIMSLLAISSRSHREPRAAIKLAAFYISFDYRARVALMRKGSFFSSRG